MILITGGAGYIGSHAAKAFHAAGQETVIFDNLVNGHREAVLWGDFVQGDLSSPEALEFVFANYPIEAVIHFAAYAYVGESVTDPAKYYGNNVANTLHLLDVMRRHGVRNIVFSSTCATYGIPKMLPITEDMPQHPINPYGASKLMIERILADYGRAYSLKYACLRYFNAAGADPEGEVGESHEPETHLIPLVLDAASEKREFVSVFGTDYDTRDGSCIRDYVHVTDLADAHLRALNYLESGGESICLNLGNARGDSVLEVIEAAKRVTGREIAVKHAPRRPGDPPVLTGDSQMARKILGWEPQYGDIETIIRHAWYWHEHKRY